MKESIKNVSQFFPTFNSKREGLGESLCREECAGRYLCCSEPPGHRSPSSPGPTVGKCGHVSSRWARWSGSGGEVKERFWDRLPVA